MKIYHTKFLYSQFMHDLPTFPDDYVFVGEVHCNTLDEAWRLANAVEEGDYWSSKECRSTCVGDVIGDNDGRFFRVEGLGFEQIKEPVKLPS